MSDNFTLKVGKTYKVSIRSEMEVYFTSVLARIDVSDEDERGISTDTYHEVQEATYESDFYVDELTFANGVKIISGGMINFEEHNN